MAKVYARTLHKAAELIGGRQKLARFLRVPIGDLEKWLAGGAAPPTAVFLRTVDFLLEETAPQGGLSGEDDAEPPRDASAASWSPTA